MNLEQYLRALERTLAADKLPITPATTIAEAGTLDSMAVIEIQTLAEEEFGILLEPNAISDCRTIADLCRLVKLAP